MRYSVTGLHNGRSVLSDRHFDELYPSAIRALSEQHWTPVNVARKAAQFLVTKPGTKVLDIGSGVGKFCLSAAHFRPEGMFFGVEQRAALVEQAEMVRRRLDMNQVVFIHANFTQLDFKRFNSFYFYNSFYENLSGTDKIDDSISTSEQLYIYYNGYLHRQLEKLPAGTRLVTFNSLGYEVPGNYCMVESSMGDLLKYWVKV